ncbi:MAG: hypothetical protein H7Y38_01520 [Armatimonadetes bacterium]|nr:hypothetical protein [Armatimonadota bacterium]
MSRFGVGAVSPLWDAGFSANPFRALSDAEWESDAIIPIEAQGVLQSAAHVQILGDAGRGKSSLLRAIVREARNAGSVAVYEYLPHDAIGYRSDVPSGAWFCLDEAQRLPHKERKRLLTQGRERRHRLIIASHEDLSAWFESTGMSLVSLNLGNLGAAHFAAVLENRLAFFVRPFTPHATFAPDALTWLHNRFGSDLRGAERFLYEYFAAHIRAPITITADALSN